MRGERVTRELRARPTRVGTDKQRWLQHFDGFSSREASKRSQEFRPARSSSLDGGCLFVRAPRNHREPVHSARAQLPRARPCSRAAGARAACSARAARPRSHVTRDMARHTTRRAGTMASEPPRHQQSASTSPPVVAARGGGCQNEKTQPRRGSDREAVTRKDATTTIGMRETIARKQHRKQIVGPSRIESLFLDELGDHEKPLEATDRIESNRIE